MVILGLSCFYHDSAAAVIRDGRVIAAAQEERFSRVKHDSSFPGNAVRYCLEAAGLELRDVGLVVYYENSQKKLSRVVSSIITNFPSSLDLLARFSGEWLSGKYSAKAQIRKELRSQFGVGYDQFEIREVDHHLSHAASAFLPSPFEDAAILVADGVGEWATTSLGHGNISQISLDASVQFPHSIGLLYSTFTALLGFKVNSGEYKVMGLAPYGEPAYARLILDKLVCVGPDGLFQLNMDYFTFAYREKMFADKLEDLLGVTPRRPEAPIEKVHLDIARSIQDVTNHVIVGLARRLRRDYDSSNICLAGGVALNCISNSKLLSEANFKRAWIQPAAGDAGGALGAALYASSQLWQKGADAFGLKDSDYCLGPEFSDGYINSELKSLGANFSQVSEQELLDLAVNALIGGEAVGWFQGRMEFGPRALGARSILADPRSADMQQTLNRKIKFRESFRPFAPAILEEFLSEWYGDAASSPYMLFVASLKPSKRAGASYTSLTGQTIESAVPAVTHVDYSSRIQTVTSARNGIFQSLIRRFYDRTGCPMLLNTSFNIRGEPIVCTPRDAYRCFMGTDLDLLIINSFVLRKDQQSRLALAQYRDAVPLD